MPTDTQNSGKTNTWWYNLRDSNPDNDAKFAITADLSATQTAFNLTCPAGSGAPASVNTEPPKGKDNAASYMKGSVGLAVVAGALGLAVGLGSWF